MIRHYTLPGARKYARFAAGADFAKLVGKEVRLEAVLSGGAAVYSVGFR